MALVFPMVIMPMIGVDKSKWIMLMSILSILALPLTLLEYYFTRERVTEETQEEKESSIAFKTQLKAIFTDKYMIVIYLYFLIYTFSSSIKNMSLVYFCNYVLGTYNDGITQTLISVIGGIPMGIGIFAVWPLAKKFGKRNVTLAGFILYSIGSAICWIFPTNLTIMLVGQFIKNIGGLPCAYVFMALFADVLDHLEWKTGFRSDGTAMSIYNIIAVAMVGVCQGVFNGLLAHVVYIAPEIVNGKTIAAVQPAAVKSVITFGFVGLEAITGIIMAVLLKVLDFGQNIAGYVSFSLSAESGDKMKLRFGEMLDENGEFTQKNIQCANKKVVTPLQQVIYTCREGWNEYKTRFSIFGFQAGCDLNMPGGSNYMEKAVLRAVKDGTLPEEKVDASVKRILKLAFRAEALRQEKAACDYEKHHETARKAAEQGAVLLKNEDGLLPLKENKKVAVIGAMAKNMRYQGSGSSHINPVKLSQPMAFLKHAVFAEGCNDRGDTDETMLQEAVKAAESADVAVVFAGLTERFESEGFDRDSMKLPEGHLRMIEEVAKENENTVVVLFSGSVVECDWADSVKAILYMGLPGQAGGEAVANLLYGKANPCGKLAETWWKHYEDVPSSGFYGKMDDALYEEGIYVGYRYCEKAGVEVRFPLGYGLSYTTFAYSELEVDADKNTVCVNVTNTGNAAGADVVQLYIAAPQTGIHRPEYTDHCVN